MARQARRKSSTSLYHVMMRGADRRILFADDQDNLGFLLSLKRAKKASGFKLYAYCLMGNHVHLLIKEEEEPLEIVIKRLGVSYVYHYNEKYDLLGHLFQDRYKSEPVEDSAYLLTVVRYIHQNPVKAGICKKPADYRYSSYSEYLNGGALLTRDMLLKQISIDQFVEYHGELNADNCLEVKETERKRSTDEQLDELIKKRFGIQTTTDVQRMESQKQAEVIKMMVKSGGSIRQISRLTGVSIAIIRKYNNR